MWHEARRQEKKIRGMLVDYRKRADRRKEFYEKIKADPNRFLQVHGRKYKIHYEVTDMSDDMHMMAWQGQKDNLIDRFDVRAHLDYIPPPRKEEEQPQEKITEQERQVNYESFRVLAQNEFLSINESDFLRQVQLEEQFGSSDKGGGGSGGGDDKNKKKNSQANAAIGYTYEDSTSMPSHTVPFAQQILSIETSTTSSSRYDEFAKDYSDESDMDMDVSVDVKKIGTQQAHELNNYGKKYGMVSNDLFSFLTRDEDEKMSMKAMKEQEADKILGGGRKSRRERRSQREKRILGKPFTLSPPSYATKEEKIKDNEEEEEESEKSSRESKSPSVEKITFITSFGGEEELQPHSKISIPFKKAMPKSLINLRRNESFADMVKENSDKLRHLNNTERRKFDSRGGSRSRSPSRRRRFRSSSRSRRRFYRSRSRSKSRGRRNYRQSSRSSYSSRERRRSRSNSRRRYSTRRSISYRKKSYHSRSRSRDKKPSYKKSLSRKHSSSRERSRNRRAYSTSSSSSSTSSTSSTSSSSRTISPEKRVQKKKSISKEKSKSKSPIRERQVSTAPKARSMSTEKPSLAPPTTVKRYYGRRKENDSSSSLSIDSDDDDDKKQTGSNESSANDVQKVRSTDIKIGMSKSTVGGPSISNPREKLKKKMQILLNKQYKADKKAETEKTERIMQQQQERDEEMREMAIKLRKRQRELRHKYGGENQDSRSNSESDENEKSPQKNRETKSSSSSSSSEDNTERRRKSRSGSMRQRKRFKTSISRSPVRYDRSRSKSSGRNYRRRSRSRSRDYRR